MHKRSQLEGWSDPDVVEFFKNHRASYEELYDSEKYFLTPEFIKGVSSVLDVGCAAGGFYPVFEGLNSEIKYTGLDVTSATIEAARQRYADNSKTEFVLYDGTNITAVPELHQKSYELVFSSGLMHLIDDWTTIYRGMVSKSSRYVLADFRLSREQPSYTGEFIFDYDGDGQFKNTTNYHVVHMNEFLSFIDSCEEICAASLYGYQGKANSLSRNIDEVYMVFLKAQVGKREGPLVIDELPDEFVEHVPKQIVLQR